jgi:hypothetical protein
LWLICWTSFWGHFIVSLKQPISAAFALFVGKNEDEKKRPFESEKSQIRAKGNFDRNNIVIQNTSF